MSLLAKADTRQEASGSSDPGATRRFQESFRPRLRSFKEAAANGDVPEGTIWLVRIIEAGTSLNGQTYTVEALKAAAAVFEGCAVQNYAWSGDPGDEDAGHLPDLVRKIDGRGLVGNQIGTLEGVHFNDQAQALDGYLKVYDASFREHMLTAFKLGDIGEGGERDVFGFSIDADGVQDEQGNVIRITSASELTAVKTPAAGGRVRRLVASVEPEVSLAEAATVRQIAGGYGVFVDGKQVGEHETRDGAEKCAAARNRMQGAARSMPEAEIHAQIGLDESTGEQHQESTVKLKTTPKAIKVQENVATFAGQLKIWADQLSAATDDEAMPMLEAIGQAVDEAIKAFGAAGADEDEDDSAETQEASVKKDEQAGGANATQDDFARMSAGMDKVREALKSGDASKLREAAVNVVGEDPQPDEKDKHIAVLTEKLKGQAISQAMIKLGESLADGAAPTVLKLIDRSVLTFNDDFSEVGGLKEAIKEVVKSFPGFAKTEGDASATPAAPAVEPVAVVEAAPVVAATPAAGEVPVLGQAVALRESARVEGGEPTRAQFAKLQRLERRMLQGDVKAMKKHRDLRALMGV